MPILGTCDQHLRMKYATAEAPQNDLRYRKEIWRTTDCRSKQEYFDPSQLARPAHAEQDSSQQKKYCGKNGTPFATPLPQGPRLCLEANPLSRPGRGGLLFGSFEASGDNGILGRQCSRRSAFTHARSERHDTTNNMQSAASIPSHHAQPAKRCVTHKSTPAGALGSAEWRPRIPLSPEASKLPKSRPPLPGRGRGLPQDTA